MLKRHRRLERCRSSYRHSGSNWASAGQARRPAHDYFLGARRTWNLEDRRRPDGSWERTALRDVDRCVGDIGNMNGELACNRAGGNYGSSRDRDYRRPWPGNGYGDGNRDYGPGWGASSDYNRYRGDLPPAGYPS